jgi:predicted nucleotidyltransferase component of viral defense system
MMDALHETLDPWLGKPKRKQGEGRVTFTYRFQSEDVPPVPLKLKVETNTREHFAVFGLGQVPFEVSSRWFEGRCQVQTYELDELLATKLRALYQRKAGRDLFDLAVALGDHRADPDRIVRAFRAYMDHENHPVTRALFEENLALKMRDAAFLADISPLLSPGFVWDPEAEAPLVSSRLIARLPGDPWKGEA